MLSAQISGNHNHLRHLRSIKSDSHCKSSYQRELGLSPQTSDVGYSSVLIIPNQRHLRSIPLDPHRELLTLNS